MVGSLFILAAILFWLRMNADYTNLKSLLKCFASYFSYSDPRSSAVIRGQYNPGLIKFGDHDFRSQRFVHRTLVRNFLKPRLLFSS